MKRRLSLLLAAALGIAALAAGVFFLLSPRLPLPVSPPPGPPAPAYLTTWPWPQSAKESVHSGITHWYDASSPDGTVLDFFDFDFGANPHLRFEIYDQDQDDTHPFDDYADCWPMGVGQATRHLNETGRGTVVAAWHGLFFNTIADPHNAAIYAARHVTPVVLNGKVHCNVGQSRWTFGARYSQADSLPQFKTRHEPDKVMLAQEFTFAAGGAQCLIKDGRPLKLHPFPNSDAPAPPQPVPCASDEAGYIPNVDWIKTSRATMGWSRDSRHFYLLFLKQQGTEGGAIAALHGHGRPTGGWTVADEQRFWLSKGVWGAINSDGGDVAQLSYRQTNGTYVLLPPLLGRQVYGPDFTGAPGHGTLLYFFIRDTGR